MKKNFIKYVACALVAVMVLGTTAFAATTTTTTYGDGYITVSTQVTGATGDEQVTYLVHNSADATIEDAEILYINQKAAAEGSATFDYKVAMTDENAASLQSTIIAGSTSGATLATAEDNIDLVEVTNVVNSTDVVNAELYTVSQNWLGTEDTATLTIIADGSWKVNDVEYTAPIAMDKGTTYTITAGVVVPEVPVITETSATTGTEGEVEFKTVFATVSNINLVSSYGVKFETTEGSIDCPALGNVDGKFAVKLLDVDGNIALAEATITPYIVAITD